jgi:hypothetical protein
MDYNRNGSRNNSSIDDEVQKLLRKGSKITSQDFAKLRSMGKDEEVVARIQNAYVDKTGNITKKAKKFAQLIREKYSETQTPFHLLLEKAHKYKVKYSLTDDEFAEFQRIYEQELVGTNKNADLFPAQTNLGKVLGNVTLDNNGFSGKLNDVDAKYLQEIMKLHQASRALHAQVLLQSMQYEDCDYEALTGKYERNLHRVGEHIHPVVAAMFLPKFPVVENFFLFSNIAGIVKARFNGETLDSRPDYELFYALTTDPNDVVCDNKSTILDLMNRAQLQTQLWNNVLHLRNGQYYNASFKDFIMSVDMCRLNKQDTPDLVYGRYDGVIIKRLLSAFSFRPTVVATTPLLMNPVAFNPYSFNVRPQVTSVPMINMRLPPVLNAQNADPVELSSALEQSQFFLENGAIVPRNTSLIWSRGVLVFYVDRRATNLKFNDQLNAFSMSQLPTPIAGFERLNRRKVNFDYDFPIQGEVYKLRSVVYSDVNIQDGKETDLVIGSSALIRIPADMKTRFTENYLVYDPYGPINSHNETGSLVLDTPITKINDFDVNVDLSFRTLAETKGTVFIYASEGKIDEKKEITW